MALLDEVSDGEGVLVDVTRCEALVSLHSQNVLDLDAMDW